MSKALLYVRVSSQQQEKEGFSLDAQEKLGNEYAHRKDLKIVKSWKVSESAFRKERTAFNQMIDYAKRHNEVSHIIFDITDRMTRNDFDKIKIYTLIREYDKTVHFSRSNKIFNSASGSEDEFMLDIEVAVAKKMSNDISRKSQMGMMEKAEQGFYPSTAPFGYKNNKVTHLIDLDEEIAPFVNRAFTLMASGSYSLDMVASKLNSEGFRSKKGKRVGKSAIHHFLHNPIYYGVFRWKDKMYQGSHTPIITKELFDNVQKVLHRSSHPMKSKNNFAFNNLLNCGKCGCKVLGERKKNRYTYYHCTFSRGRHPEVGYVKEDILASMFLEPIRKITITKEIADWMRKGLEERHRNTAKLNDNRLNLLNNQLTKVNDRLSKLFDLKLDGDINDEMFKSKENEYQEHQFELKAQIAGVERTNPHFYEDGCQILELCNRMYSLYVKANYEEKAKMLKLISANYLLSDASITATYRKPFSFIAKGLSCPTWLPREDSNLGQAG